MHEVGIMQSTLALAEQQARASGGSRIHQLRLRIGRLSGVVPDAMQFAFEALRAGTMAAEATLQVDEVAATCWCEACQREFDTSDLLWECPHCRQPSAHLRKGRELELASLEIS